ncbi:hypothetical protein [Dyadobacter psychrotolerans]|uniref:Nuclear transport factor 2 family protein n=1 Tax=Dyadobacter psychrotolerans TaxID=2541721 RepID=A0A4R5E135_9BACT|nr:hypothetical protein [Dyadobacter psychrotolerans]TDE17383.1 hypothetical protein E0F88_05690 [Dyadobacter psychrotolerans]
MATSVQLFFEDYATALTSFSAENISGFYQTPMAVYSDQGVQTVAEMSEVIAFWEQGIEPYKAQNIEKAMPRVLSEQQLSETIFISQVAWDNYDSSGEKVSSETNFYILTGNKGALKISGLIIMNK